MKAFQITKPGPIENHPLKLVELEKPKPKNNEVLIKVSVCGVCRTDLHIAEGDLKKASYPIVPGHQVVGKIEALGENAKRFKVGDRVGVAWLGQTCQACEYCHTHRENLCQKSKYMGFDFQGGYAEYVVALEDYIYTLPEHFSDEQAAPLLCAGIIGYRSYLISKIQKNQTLALYGFGSSAHLMAQVAKYHQNELLVATRNEKHQALARLMNAKEVTDGKAPFQTKADSAIIFAPAGELVPKALEGLKPGGSLALAGIHMSDIPSMNYESCLFHEKEIKSVEANTREDGKAFLQLAKQIPIKPQIHCYPFEKAQEALIDLKRDAFEGSAVLTFH